MVDQNAQWRRAAGNGVRFCCDLALPRLRRPQPRSQSQTGSTRCALEETAPTYSFIPVELPEMPGNPFLDKPLPGRGSCVHSAPSFCGVLKRSKLQMREGV